MSEGAHRVLIAYDIGNDGRRDRVAVTLQSHGDRVQYSVFVVDAKAADLVRLNATLQTLIDMTTDRVLFCDLGPASSARSRMIYLGRPPKLTGDSQALIV
jgi:CRISPR-associated protein Cas2